MKLLTHQVALPLRHVFTTAHGSARVQDDVIVELRDGPFRGYGEAAPVAYHDATVADVLDALDSAREQIESADWEQPSQLWQQMLPVLGDNRCALCALDEAAHDLWGKRQGRPVYELWGLNLDNNVPSNFTIGLDTVENMVRKMQEMPSWPSYKIKLGTPNDLQIIRRLREHTDAVFRVDANTAWDVERTIAHSHRLKELGVELIEQPLPVDDWDGARRVFTHSALPIVADESCVVEEDVARCRGHFHGVNIKLTKCGGLTPARRMIDRARQYGMKVMVGCMTESTVGISAIGQLLPLLDYVDMDGAELLSRDVARGVKVVAGRAVYPEENGCGVTYHGFDDDATDNLSGDDDAY